MSAHRNIDRICIVVLVLTLLLTVAFMNGEKLGIQAIADEDAESYTGSAYFTTNDLDGDWADNAYTTYVTLDGTTGKIDGNGAYFLDGDLVISNGGWYVLTGTLENDRIVVDAADSSKVWIRLNGVTVQCSDDACLRVDQADKVFLTLAEGTENSFSSGSSYSEEALSDNTGGAIFSHDDLTINGSGSLTITAGYKHGIDANDSLVITGGTISITAPQDGIHVNDSFRFAQASLTIQAGDDGIHSDDELYIESGTIEIPSCYEGLEAVTIDIAGGDITITPSDDGLNANGSTGFQGRPGMEQTDSVEEETYIRVSGGTITIVNETGQDADGLDSNGSIYIDGGDIRISLRGDGSNCALDYGSESGGACIVTGGSILAFGGSSMVEAFSADCTQCAVIYNLDSTAQAGTRFCVMDPSGEEILSYTPECSFSSVAFSTAKLTVGQTYTIVYGENSTDLTLDSTAVLAGNSGGMEGGQPSGRMPGNSDEGMQAPEDGSFPAEGETFDGERPTPPDGEFDDERPTPPDGESGRGPQGRGEDGMQQPDRSDEQSGDSSETSESESGADGDAQPGRPEQGFAPGDAAEEQEAESEATGFTSLADLDGKVWVLLGVSILALAAGILIAVKYRK